MYDGPANIHNNPRSEIGNLISWSWGRRLADLTPDRATKLIWEYFLTFLAQMIIDWPEFHGFLDRLGQFHRFPQNPWIILTFFLYIVIFLKVMNVWKCSLVNTKLLCMEYRSGVWFIRGLHLFIWAAISIFVRSLKLKAIWNLGFIFDSRKDLRWEQNIIYSVSRYIIYNGWRMQDIWETIFIIECEFDPSFMLNHD